MIVILRDPVERAHSNGTHLWSPGLEPVGPFGDTPCARCNSAVTYSPVAKLQAQHAKDRGLVVRGARRI
jgi:hypothetical protein